MIVVEQGYASALMGNTLMCSHFAHRGERSAVNVQLIGIASNLLVLAQVTRSAYNSAYAIYAIFLSTLPSVSLLSTHMAVNYIYTIFYLRYPRFPCSPRMAGYRV